VTVGFLEQDYLEQPGHITVMDLAMTAFEEARSMEQGMMDVAEAMSQLTDYDSDEYHDLADKLAHMQTRYAVLEGDKAESKAAEVLEGLGFATEDLSKPLTS